MIGIKVGQVVQLRFPIKMTDNWDLWLPRERDESVLDPCYMTLEGICWTDGPAPDYNTAFSFVVSGVSQPCPEFLAKDLVDLIRQEIIVVLDEYVDDDGEWECLDDKVTERRGKW